MALAGVDSRRKCEAFVLRGDVMINGVVVRNLAQQVDPAADEILYKGRQLLVNKRVYYLLHKPKGVTCTASDPHAKRNLFDVLPPGLVPVDDRSASMRCRVFPVGRLDRETTGLLLVTNDGALAQRLLHPRYGLERVYHVTLSRAVDRRDLDKLTKGIRLSDGMARAKSAKQISPRQVQIVLCEGKKREVRRMFMKLGYPVSQLARIAFGPLTLGDLACGRGRYLRPGEIKALQAAAKI